MNQIRENVFNYFGVSGDVLENKAKAEDLEAFFDGAIEPFAIMFSEALTKMLFTERERAQGSYLIANANRLQYMSISAKLEMIRDMVDRGIMSEEEGREALNYGPRKEGDTFVIRGEYYNVNDKVMETEEEEDASEE